MAAERVLFVNQGIIPYLETSYESEIGRYLPLSMQERGIDTRVFMPKYGVISERKNLLHEVIRLSGQNIIINNNSHSLIIKVSSIPAIHMQIYFIHNEHYFGRKYLLTDKTGKYFSDNDERAIFYARGVMETVKNLAWSPDIIHCHGWISCLVPVFLRKLYVDSPFFSNTKIVFSVYGDHASKSVSRSFATKLSRSGIPLASAEGYKKVDYETSLKLAIDYSDGVVISHESVSDSIRAHITDSNKPFFEHQENEYGEPYLELYNQIMDK